MNQNALFFLHKILALVIFCSMKHWLIIVWIIVKFVEEWICDVLSPVGVYGLLLFDRIHLDAAQTNISYVSY